MPSRAGGHAVPDDDDDAVLLDRYAPDYARRCEVCGQVPVVIGIKDGKVAYRGTMCGVCTWGDASMADPAAWNE